MSFKEFFDEALTKGEHIKNEIVSELTKSKLLREMLKSDHFARAVSGVVRTRDEVAKSIRKNVKAVFQIMAVPTRDDLAGLERKIDGLEKSLDRVAKKVITVKSLKKINLKKAAKQVHHVH
ncbi:MAG: phasin family protein [Deltaproteobacteria bacterium]|nr:phasin family protein [Deltaproteobacteria bacterium]